MHQETIYIIVLICSALVSIGIAVYPLAAAPDAHGPLVWMDDGERCDLAAGLRF
jgi:hypothetical protein